MASSVFARRRRSRERASAPKLVAIDGYYREKLDNGIMVVAERMPSIRSISIGVWLMRGSRHEDAEAAGMSHFIEHMLFKGTTHRTAQDIARQIDAVGGGLDAFTGKEFACYHAKALDTEIGLLVDLLSDLIKNPLFSQDDVKKEQRVIFEEIKMAADSPEDLVHEQLVQRLWSRHALGRPILGNKHTVASFDAKSVRRFWSHVYAPSSLLIAVAGSFDPRRLMDLLRAGFEDHRLESTAAPETPPRDRPAFVAKDKDDLEQVHICLGAPGIPQGHPDRHAAYVLNTLLGGSMSSRLFQSIREERGLVYSIYSYLNSYRDAGYLVVQAGCSPRNLREVALLTVQGIAEVTATSVSDEELARAKGHLKGNLMLGLESSGGRMSNIARQELYFGRQSTLDEMVAEIDGVTAEDVRRVARALFAGKPLLASLVGKVKDLKLSSGDLEIPA